uniref:SH3 domain-containing protein n=1 Tax=Arcella intermedia TaxID=1963864 RepID=A0A6B2LJZ3_9EUKA
MNGRQPLETSIAPSPATSMKASPDHAGDAATAPTGNVAPQHGGHAQPAKVEEKNEVPAEDDAARRARSASRGEAPPAPKPVRSARSSLKELPSIQPAGETSSESKNNDPKNTFKKRAIAMWDFTGGEEYEQLAFKAGDEIIVIEEDDESGWWWGELNGQEGYFPVNYTEVKKPDVKVNQDTIDPKIKALQERLKQ